MGDFQIRPLERQHLDGLLEVETLSFPTPWSRDTFEYELETNQLATYLVALVGDKVVGYGGMWVVLDEAHITNIGVHPLYRRQGIGQGLLRGLLLEAIKKAVKSLTLEVRESNKAAQALYGQHGFLVQGRRKNYYQNDQEDALIMWRYFDGI